ncbi:MAG: BrnA antitoxin family protein [Alphaproteobacteria bacterium]|nr:BrnA antitoxin family protein [Alphaproteobacteria bacterium]MBM3733307.1 BrnA antitoxin family protein [Acidimicrobiia bacterium]MBM3952510.1 BrnA antitoxin family protein [Rhodospirillales bacterium]
MIGKKRSSKKTWVDPDQAPELTEAWFAEAELRRGEKLIRRGRPPSAERKEAIHIRLDRDVVAYFRGTGRGWQGRINALLRRSVARARGPRKKLAEKPAKTGTARAG